MSNDKMREALEKIVKVVENTHSSTFGLDLNQVHVIAETVLSQQPESEPVAHFPSQRRPLESGISNSTTLKSKPAQVPDGWHIGIEADGTAIIKMPDGGGVCVSSSENEIARIVLRQLAEALLAAPSIAEKREPSALQIDDALELVRLLEVGALNDCVDNDGVVYASEWLHEAIHGLNRYIQEARRPEPPEEDQ